jgi:APA family basic amino acid/polyamine antiporter
MEVLKTSLVRGLGLVETTSILIGTVIGTGVFLKSAMMAQLLGSPTLVLLAWLVAGVLSTAGACCYAELGAQFPFAGGEYVYLREAYGGMMAFICGWTHFWLNSPAAAAAYAVGASLFIGAIVPLDGMITAKAVAVLLIIGACALNCFKVAIAGRLQSLLSLLKVLSILGLSVMIVFFGKHVSAVPAPVVAVSPWSLSHFGQALIGALWAYQGWAIMTMMAGEVKDPKRTIPRAILVGMAFVTVCYLLLNFAYFYALPIQSIMESNSKLFPHALPVATLAAQTAMGPMAVRLLSVIFVISVFGAMNSSILAGSRIPYAMARDGLIFKYIGHLNSKSRVPVTAVISQGTCAIVYALLGTFDQLTGYVVFAAWSFYSLSAGSLFIFRRRHPQLARPYSVPFYPVTPLIFIFGSAFLIANSIWNAPMKAGVGVLILLPCVPLYFWLHARKVKLEKKTASARSTH